MLVITSIETVYLQLLICYNFILYIYLIFFLFCSFCKVLIVG